MKNYILKSTLVLIAASICFVSCNNNTDMFDKTGKSITTNSIEKVENTENIALNYSFYLPEKYNGNDSLPVIYMLDPHADGNKPLSKYAQAANKFGYILIASNAIKNGQGSKQSENIFNGLIAEAKSRFVIDEKRMFVSGFSGGAKIAIIFAQQLPEIIGVAACGASLPLLQNEVPNYYYAGLIGNQDFNYLEVNQTFAIFDKQGFDYTSVVFNGGHNWPPAESFEMALIGFDIYSMKMQRLEKNNEYIDMVYTRMIDSINYFEKAGNVIDENIYIRQAARWFYGIKNTKELSLKSATIERSQNFFNQVKKRQKLIQTEVKLRAEFIRAIENKDLTWWTDEIEKIKQSINKKDVDIAQVSSRLLNYLSMASFMLTKNNLEDDYIDGAAKKLEIYKLVDPNNPDVYLMHAVYYMQTQDITAMNESYAKAVELGFSDIETYKADSFWAPLFSNSQLKK